MSRASPLLTLHAMQERRSQIRSAREPGVTSTPGGRRVELSVAGSVAECPYPTLLERARAAARRGQQGRARALYESALHRLPEASDHDDAVRLLYAIARTRQREDDAELSREAAETALVVAEAHGDFAALGRALALLAAVCLRDGDSMEAERLYRRIAATPHTTPRTTQGAAIARNLGTMAAIRGDRDTAEAHYLASRAAYRALGRASDECAVLVQLGELQVNHARWDDAAHRFDEAMAVAEVASDHTAQLIVELHRTEAHLLRDDVARAERTIARAKMLARRVGDRRWQGRTCLLGGMVARESGALAVADRQLARAIALATRAHDVLLVADATRELGELRRRQGRNRDALACLQHAQRLFSQLRAQRDLADVSRRTGRLRDDFLAVARRWGHALERADRFTQGHCERVAHIACALAAADGMDEDARFWFGIGARLHDVGKAVLPPAMLGKCGPLTPDEWVVMRSHPSLGVAMLADIDFPRDIRAIVESHHERWDGGGYPHGLAGTAIPRDARIVCIADVYDALTSRRSYKCPLTHHHALSVMRADAGRQFDPDLFALFERVAAEHAPEWRRLAARHRRSRPGAARDESPEPSTDTASATTLDACRCELADDDGYRPRPVRRTAALQVVLRAVRGSRLVPRRTRNLNTPDARRAS